MLIVDRPRRRTAELEDVLARALDRHAGVHVLDHVVDVPIHESVVPLHAGDVPAHANDVRCHADDIPAHADDVLFHAGDVPAHAEGVSPKLAQDHAQPAVIVAVVVVNINTDVVIHAHVLQRAVVHAHQLTNARRQRNDARASVRPQKHRK